MRLANLIPDRNSRLVRWGGYALFAIAITYCVAAIARLGADEVLAALSPQAWLITGAVALLYGTSLLLLAIGWSVLAAQPQRLSLSEIWMVYGTGVLAKYIPGSVFQYGSRQLLGAKFGLEQKPMVKASLVEAGLHLAMAMIPAAALSLGADWAVLCLFAVVGAVMAVRGGPLICAAGCQLAFFACFTALVGAVAHFALAIPDAWYIAGIFMIAWAAGFLVPVAPGGLGVRESVLLALTLNHEAAGAIAAFAVLTRLATSLGDAWFGMAGYSLLIARRTNRQASS